jgi:transcriptional regulator with XRE-family HTH domain
MQRPLDPATRLRQAREAKGLSCRQLAETTKLSVRTIEALENDCLSSLPEGIYRRSIVRSVASEVGLNPDQLLRDFSAAHPVDLPAPASADLVVSAEPSRSIQRAMAFVGAMLPLLAGVAYFGWPSARPADVTAVVEVARLPAARQPEILPAGGFAEASPMLPRPVVVTLTISSRCQLRIVVDGRERLARTVEQGESLPVELGEELWLIGDNASAVQFSINGQAGRLLGAPGDQLSVRIGRDDYQDFLVRH